MPKEQVEKPAPQQQPEEKTAPAPKDLENKGSDLKEEMNALIDEIDGVLEENAEEFVKSYVQRGGQ